MCGIFAYMGEKEATSFLLNGLRKLEYRGYDSAGIVEINNAGDFYLEKSVGKVGNLVNLVEKNEKDLTNYHIGIAHTRWATHGGVTLENCHPHYSLNKRFFLVHNGIIENYIELKKSLIKDGYTFYGDTDSEVLVKLIEKYFEKDLEYTIKKITKILEGAYAIAVIDRENPDVLVGAKIGSPLVLGFGQKEFFLSSDPNALNQTCNNFIPLEDGEIVIIKDNNFNIFNFNNELLADKEYHEFEEMEEERGKGDYAHYMLKEIYEIPYIFKNAIAGRINYEKDEIKSNTLAKLTQENIKKIEIIASGTSYNAGLTAATWFEELADLPTQVHMSTEFKYKKHFINQKTLYVFISQSGETADSLECLKIVKNKGGLTFGVVNVVGSSIARLTDMGLYTHSGTEIGVASTKAFIGQLTVLLLMSLALGNSRNLEYLKYKEIIGALENFDEKINEVLKRADKIKAIALRYSDYKNMFFLGRNLLYPIAMEGSLKLKEITYHHSEAYSSGELKHGPLSLIEENFPTVLLNPKTKLYDKNISTLKEVGAREGKVIGFITDGDKNKDLYTDIVEIPDTIEELTPFLLATTLDLFAYYIALNLGREIDKPRNLAKSVTVE
ncbi:MAG: glutamine--fructose-6-phosphate transaminase (isomerizing) [Candidatus Gracilibacteria bacterium]|nr:glutamine--fructose-6-phosphate transaminase (isomerizing) [Candidatus Gracilibacteria bacterium]